MNIVRLALFGAVFAGVLVSVIPNLRSRGG